MIEWRKRKIPRRTRILVATLAALALAAFLQGCQTLGYYKQAVQGECQILAHRQSIAKLVADPQTPSDLKAKFQAVLEIRQFADKTLRLPVDDQYLRYVDLHRPYVVWNVHAAHEFSLEPKNWWYPFVGSLKYRGYFSESGAHRYAKTLQKNGWEVYVEGVQAYSTLGWFKDPLLNTFIHEPACDLAETLFHELAHQRIFISGDTDFNEAFATAVGEEGVRRWLGAKGEPGQYEKYAAALARNEQFVQLIMKTREELASFYGDKSTPEGLVRQNIPKEQEKPELRRGKELIIARLRESYAKLKAQWGGMSGYDGWFARPLTNAQLNTVATYYDLVPGFRALLQKNGGDLEKFFGEIRALGKLSKNERHRRVKAAEELLTGQPTKAPPSM